MFWSICDIWIKSLLQQFFDSLTAQSSVLILTHFDWKLSCPVEAFTWRIWHLTATTPSILLSICLHWIFPYHPFPYIHFTCYYKRIRLDLICNEKNTFLFLNTSVWQLCLSINGQQSHSYLIKGSREKLPKMMCQLSFSFPLTWMFLNHISIFII